MMDLVDYIIIVFITLLYLFIFYFPSGEFISFIFLVIFIILELLHSKRNDK